MSNKTRNKNIKYLVGLICAFLLVASCGSQAPDVGENYCPELDETVGLSTVGSGGTTQISSTSSTVASNTTSTATSSTGGTEEIVQFDAPNADEISSRLHSCHKLTYVQLGNFLRNRGVALPPGSVSDTKGTSVSIFGQSTTLSSVFGGSGAACEMAVTDANGTNDPVCGGGETCFCNQDDKSTQVNRSCLDVGNNSPDAVDGYCVAKPATSGYLYFSGKDALGYPKLDSRLGEREEHSTASAMKLMDIFVQSAPQIIANIGDPIKAPACTLNGKNLPMFSADGTCVEESVSCLLGMPASDDHMLLCNLILQKAKPGDQADMLKKRNIAVAVLLSAAHSCQ